MAIAERATQADSANPTDADFGPWLRKASILIVDDEPGMRNFLKRTLQGGYDRRDQVHCCSIRCCSRNGG